MGKPKCRKTSGCAFTLKRPQVVNKKDLKNTSNFLQLDAPLLCNNSCALLNNEEKTEEKDLYDFVFSSLEDGSNVTKSQVAHTPRQDA